MRHHRRAFVSVFGEQEEAVAAWLDRSLEVLAAAEAEVMRPDQPWGLIHCDIRSDNLRFRDGRLVLFDWALACKAPLVLDVLFFLPSVAGEGGSPLPALYDTYVRAMTAAGLTFPTSAARASAAAVAGYFATHAGKPLIAGLPRLRQVQRMQLGPALAQAAAFLDLPTPTPEPVL